MPIGVLVGLLPLSAAEPAAFETLDVDGVLGVAGFLAGAFGLEGWLVALAAVSLVLAAALDAVPVAFFTGAFFVAPEAAPVAVDEALEAAPVPAFFAPLAAFWIFAAIER